ncbi:MAG: phosphoribosyltransferase family protein, partial [Candidatus Micrarchaeaceae archaeon]
DNEHSKFSKKLMRGAVSEQKESQKEPRGFLEFEKKKTNFEMFRYSDMLDAAKAIAEMFASKYGRPDAILYIERGGMVPAALVANELGVGRLFHVSAGYYTDVGIPSKNVKIWNIDSKIQGATGGRILLIDDIADTGKTLKDVYGRVKKLTSSEILTATFVYKSKSIIKPDFYYVEKDNSTWIVFDYEENETRHSFSKSKNKAGLDFLEEEFGKGASTDSEAKFQLLKNQIKDTLLQIINEGDIPAAIAYVKPYGNVIARIASDYLNVKAMLAIDADGDFNENHAKRMCKKNGRILLVDDCSEASGHGLKEALAELSSAGLSVRVYKFQGK